MTIGEPYAEELVRVARKVVWFEAPERTLGNLRTFLAHLMVYGSSADVEIVERYVLVVGFRKVLEDASAGVFTQDVWRHWHERLD